MSKSSTTKEKVIAVRGKHRLLSVGDGMAVIADEQGRRVSHHPMPVASFLSRGYWRKPGAEEGKFAALLRWVGVE